MKLFDNMAYEYCASTRRIIQADSGKMNMVPWYHSAMRRYIINLVFQKFGFGIHSVFNKLCKI